MVSMLMKLEKMIESANKGIDATIRLFTWVAAGALAIMMLFIVVNVVGRFASHPVAGAMEIVGLLLIIVVFLSVAYTEVRRMHVHVELVVSRLSRRSKAILASIMYFLSAAFFLTMAWQGGVLTWSRLYPSIFTSITLSIPLAPFMFVIALGSLMLGLKMVIRGFRPIPPEVRGEGEKEISS